jgi:hypothetical protein
LVVFLRRMVYPGRESGHAMKTYILNEIRVGEIREVVKQLRRIEGV